ncbi:MAG: M23 family metallopeptidase, partial [Chroococcidiopsis sp.]
MKQFQLLRFQRLGFTVSKKSLLLVALSLASLPLLAWHQKKVTAEEVAQNKIATGNLWRKASFPVENFQYYSSPFGYRRSPTGGSGLEFHSGLDLVAPQGSYVRSWWTGTIVKVADRDACGTHVIIRSGAW